MVFRINKDDNFTCMSNYHLRDKNLSLKAKGLLSLMFSLPDNWDYSINGLTAICIESRGVIKNILDELKANKYLEITKLMPNETKTGRFEYIYDIYEQPKQGIKKQGIEKQGIEKQALVFDIQLNTNKLNTNKLNTKKINIPTLEEVESYIKEKSLNVNGKQFYDYFNTGNWVDSKGNKVKNWKQKLLTWNSYKQPKQEKANTLTRNFGKLNQFYMNNEE